MKMELLDSVESKSLKKEIPHFEVGDTVDVHCRIYRKATRPAFGGIVTFSIIEPHFCHKSCRSASLIIAPCLFWTIKRGSCINLDTKSSWCHVLPK